MATARIGASGQPIPMGGIGDILEGGRGYLGPGRLIPPAIGGGSAWGLQSLWNKITGGEDETEEEIDINDDDIFTQEEKDLLNELPPGLRESTGKNLKKQKEKLLSVTEERLKGTTTAEAASFPSTA